MSAAPSITHTRAPSATSTTPDAMPDDGIAPAICALFDARWAIIDELGRQHRELLRYPSTGAELMRGPILAAIVDLRQESARLRAAILAAAGLADTTPTDAPSMPADMAPSQDSGQDARQDSAADTSTSPDATSTPDTSTPDTSEATPAATRRPDADALAVLALDGLWLGRGTSAPEHLTGQGIPAPDASAHAGALLALAHARGIAQLWIHPDWARAAGIPEQLASGEGRPVRELAHPFISDALADGWDIRPAALASWLYTFRPGISHSGVDLVMPQLDEYLRTWADAPDGRTLLHALRLYADALGGWQFKRWPGGTGTSLLRWLHSGNRATLDLAPVQLPAIARKETAKQEMERQRHRLGRSPSWLRALTPDERGRPYLHVYDKNAAWLGACSSIALGFGEPVRLGASDANAAPLVFDQHKPLPGYWLARITWKRAPVLPDPFLLAPPSWGTVPKTCWYTTPMIAYAHELGAAVTLADAWVWPEHHRVMEPWYKRLRGARAQLATLAGQDAPGAMGARLALQVVKDTYRQTIGALASARRARASKTDALYRPDWRDAIIATAHVNMYRQLYTAYEAAGVAPFAIATDALYYASDEPDAVAACPPALRLGAGVGQYKAANTVPLADMLPLLDDLGSGRAAGKILKQLNAALKVGHAGADDRGADDEDNEYDE